MAEEVKVTNEYPKMVYPHKVIVNNRAEEDELLGRDSRVEEAVGAGFLRSIAEEVVETISVPEVTKEHQAFLKSRGYEAKTLKSTRIFMENLNASELKGFLADLENWKSGKEDEG
jgi:hypothetical protein